MEELRRNHQTLGLSKDQNFQTFFHARFNHSRFSTTVRALPAPHLDMDPALILADQREKKIFVKDFVIPGKMGMWTRLFSSGEDTHGRLIKVEPDSILGIPASIIQEVGRINHIEGNPHYMVRVVMVAIGDKEVDDGNTQVPLLQNLQRSYPHLEETLKRLREENDGRLPEGWEKSLRTVSLSSTKHIKEVKGLDPADFHLLDHLKSVEATAFQDEFGI
jgi:hypothetical protein